MTLRSQGGSSEAPSDRPVVGVLALQGDVAEHCAMLDAAGARPLAVRRPDQLAGLGGIVLPGGESTTMAKLARSVGLFDPLAARLRGGLPAFGTCAGMVLLADRLEDATADQETLGGLDVVVRRNAFGRQVDSFEADLAVHLGQDEDRSPCSAVFIRAPWVDKVGGEVAVVATVAAGRAVGRIVAVRQGHLLATSFHPELTGDHRFHAFFVDLVRRAGTPGTR
jgi:5'-phosphate synthase pdxT subunit